jgi:hypothetical protein
MAILSAGRLFANRPVIVGRPEATGQTVAGCARPRHEARGSPDWHRTWLRSVAASCQWSRPARRGMIKQKDVRGLLDVGHGGLCAERHLVLASGGWRHG